MKILFICHRIPYPPNKGDKIRSYHMLTHLAETHQVHLACLIDDPHDVRYTKELRKICESVDYDVISPAQRRLRALTGLVSKRPLSISYFSSRRLNAKIAEAIERKSFDVIIVFSSGVAHFVRDVRDTPKIIDLVDVDSAKWAQYAEYQPFPWSSIYRLEGHRLAGFEKKLASDFDWCLLSSAWEQRQFRSNVPNGRTAVIRNGVDLEFFRPDNGKTSSDEAKSSGIVFTGAMDYYPNVDAVTWFADRILPLVRKVVPEVRFTVVGNKPAPAVRRLASAERGVEVTGYVEDVRPYLWNAGVFVAPFRIAQGVLNKILEAMAAGVPVVATPQAVRGLEVEPGRELILEEDEAGFASKVVKILNDQELRQSLTAAALDYVVRQHDWSKNLRVLDDILAKVTLQTPLGLEEPVNLVLPNSS